MWWTRDLRLGDTGDDVKALEEFLQYPVTGAFDEWLDGGVRRWQSAHRLTTDGVVGPVTAATMGGYP